MGRETRHVQRRSPLLSPENLPWASVRDRLGMDYVSLFGRRHASPCRTSDRTSAVTDSRGRFRVSAT